MKKKRWQISEMVWKWILFHDWIYLLSQKRISYHFSKLPWFCSSLQFDSVVFGQWEHVSKVWKQFTTVILPLTIRRNKNKWAVTFKLQTYLTITWKNSGGHAKHRLIQELFLVPSSKRIVSCSFFQKCYSLIFQTLINWYREERKDTLAHDENTGGNVHKLILMAEVFMGGNGILKKYILLVQPKDVYQLKWSAI